MDVAPCRGAFGARFVGRFEASRLRERLWVGSAPSHVVGAVEKQSVFREAALGAWRAVLCRCRSQAEWWKRGFAFEKLPQKQVTRPFGGHHPDATQFRSAYHGLLLRWARRKRHSRPDYGCLGAGHFGYLHRGAGHCACRCGHLTMRSSGQRGQAMMFPDILSARCRLTRRYTPLA